MEKLRTFRRPAKRRNACWHWITARNRLRRTHNRLREISENEGEQKKKAVVRRPSIIYFEVAVIKTYDRNKTKLRNATANTIVTAVCWTLPPLECVPASGFIW